MNYTYILFSTLLSPKQNRRYVGSVFFDRTVRFFILFIRYPISLLFFSSAFLSTGCYFSFRTKNTFGVSFLFPWLCYTTEKTLLLNARVLAELLLCIRPTYET